MTAISWTLTPSSIWPPLANNGLPFRSPIYEYSFEVDLIESTLSMASLLLRVLQQFLHSCVRLICCCNMFTDPLPSSGRLLWLNSSGFQRACHNILLPCKGSKWWERPPFTKRRLTRQRVTVVDNSVKIRTPSLLIASPQRYYYACRLPLFLNGTVTQRKIAAYEFWNKTA
jgi:hypothetical protein